MISCMSIPADSKLQTLKKITCGRSLLYVSVSRLKFSCSLRLHLYSWFTSQDWSLSVVMEAYCVCVFSVHSHSCNVCLSVYWVWSARAHKNGQLKWERVTPIEPVVPSKLLNRTKNKTTCHMLSNNSLRLCSRRSALLFLILAVNSYQFQILQSCTLSI